MREFLAVAKALSEPNRARALMALRGGELCVCKMIELLGLAPSTVSRHMAVLHRAGLVVGRKDGRWIYYRLAEAGSAGRVADAIRWAQRSLDSDALVLQDVERLKTIRAAPQRQQQCQ